MSKELEKRVIILQEQLIKNRRKNEEMKEMYEKQNNLSKEIIDKLKKENESINGDIINYQKIILDLKNNISKLEKSAKKFDENEIDLKNLSDNEKELYSYNNNIIKESKSPLDLIKLNIISKACCRLEYTNNNNQIYGNGFFIELPILNTKDPIRGLMTSNNFINENNINNIIEIKIIFNIIKKSVIITNKNNFKFTDYFLNFTFIQLNENEINKLTNFDINFLQINEEKEIPNNIILIKNNINGTITFEEGILISEWGYQIYHTISNSFDFIGSPLISPSTNKIISILTNKDKNCKYNPSTNIKIISQVIKNIYTTKIDKIKYKVKNLSKKEIEELNKIGLKQTKSKLIFESPSSKNVTPLWFYRTNHNWYWTPVDPNLNNKNALPCNWLIIYPKGTLKVVGGYWSEEEPAQRNIELIHWLEKNGFKYLV
jgi:hypothetical protein